VASSILGAIGGAIFGPIGGLVGRVVGSLLFPPSSQDSTSYGPRLNDLKVQTSGYGEAIPLVYGVMQVAGNVIWLKNNKLDETRHETESSGGKGGGGSTQTTVTYTYAATFSVMLCAGTIVGVRKIWADSVLLYDTSDTAAGVSLHASNDMANSIEIYPGNATQKPDPTMVSILGLGNVPAYRHRAYIVFDNLQLEKFGNRIPNIRVEVVQLGEPIDGKKLTDVGDHVTDYDGYAFTVVDNGVFRLWDRTRTAYARTSSVASVGLATTGSIYLFDADGNLLEEEQAHDNMHQGLDSYPYDRAFPWVSIGRLGTPSVPTFVYIDLHSGYIPYPAGPFRIQLTGYLQVDDDYESIHDLAADLPQDREVISVVISADNQRMMVIMTEVGESATGSNVTGVWYMFDSDGEQVDEGTCEFADEISPGAGVSSLGMGNIGQTSIFGCIHMEGDYKHIWSVYAPGSTENTVIVWEIDEHNVFKPKQYFNTRLDTAYGFTRPTMFADNGYMIVAGQNVDENGGHISTFVRTKVYASTGIALSSLVSDIFTRSGLDASEYDTTDLTDIVDGYVVARPISGRAALEPLMPAFFFDVVESDDKLKCVSRGVSVAASVTEAELGVAGEDSLIPYIEVTRAQEQELPLEVNIQYISPSLDYQNGNQRSRRQVVESVFVHNLPVPISMSASKAKQTAEILHSNAWTERESYKFNLPAEYAYLEPTDVVDVTANGFSYNVRITSADSSPGSFISFEGVSNATSDYVSNASSIDGEFGGRSISVIGPTRMELLDIPLLSRLSDTVGHYIAMRGYFSSWTGAAIQRSNDNGDSYDAIVTWTAEATMGSATNALGDIPNAFLLDTLNSLNVNLAGDGALSSDTDINVFNGSNVGILWAGVAWEVIQWTTATLEGNGTYTLTNLLRGRLGTEGETYGHAVGDRFIVLTNETIATVGSLVNANLRYRATSLGNFSEDAAIVDFVNTGVRSMPYAPYHLKTVRDAAGDITWTWLRRSRKQPPQPFWSTVLNEETESYSIDVYDGTDVVRTITTASTTAYYTASAQTVDFASVQGSVTIGIFQISADVGRGIELEVTT